MIALFDVLNVKELTLIKQGTWMKIQSAPATGIESRPVGMLETGVTMEGLPYLEGLPYWLSTV